MTQYINKAAVIEEIERLEKENKQSEYVYDSLDTEYTLKSIISFINTLEVSDVNLDIFGAIARHIIAVKEHIEDMRFDKEEWLTLEKIGYPERFKARKPE